MTAPIEVTVKRHRCPHCRQSRSTRKAAVEHMGRCWYAPGNRSCKTCAWFTPADSVSDEGCSKGVTVGKPRQQATEDAWRAWASGWGADSDAPPPDEDPPTPFPLNCNLWEVAE
jgi:hypothetical protein